MKICIVSHNAYGALTGENAGHIGGVERQSALLSNWLSQQGHSVSIITWDEGGEKTEIVNGIEIIKLCREDKGIPSVRFFTPRWTSLVAALKKADAEVYYHNCAEYFTGQIALWCKIKHKAFVYSVASDADCQIKPMKTWSLRDKYFFQYGLKHADNIICQTHTQKRMLAANFNLKSTVISMPGTPPQGTSDPETQFNKQKVIWVGRVQTVKRLEWLLDIATALPQFEFDIIGPTDHNRHYTDLIFSKAKTISNIRFIGKLNRDEMAEVYKNATVLCSTSIYEGFPNTFLEAWSYGVPVISTVDPDKIINTHKLGTSTTNKPELISAIARLLSNKEEWQSKSTNCFRYYECNHEMNKVQAHFEQLFLNYADMKKIKGHFNKQSKSWSDYYTLPVQSISQFDLQVRTTFASKYLENNNFSETDTLVDVGCGTGDASAKFMQLTAGKMLAVDVTEDMITQAKVRYPNIDFSVADATNLPFQSEFSKCLISMGTIEYIRQYKQTLSEFNRVLTPDGQLIISVPNQHSLFRKLRSLEQTFLMPIKKVIALLRQKSSPEVNYYHKKWKPDTFAYQLEKHGFDIKDKHFCTYGFLSPRLIKSEFNLKLCLWMNKNIDTQGRISKLFAHTVVFHAIKASSISS